MTLTLSKTSRPLDRNEHELVAATRAGDDRAFEDLYARYRDRILGFIVSKVHDHGRAEDIAQDVFMSALRRLRGSDQAIAFKPWIYEIAKNACIDEFRRGSRSREVPLETDGEFATDRQPTLSVVTPPAAVESKQRLDDLCGAFGGLSANHHQLLAMREFEGMTYDEIGARLNMTRQMVESGLFRARRKLGAEYEELASGRRCEQVQGAIEAGTMQSIRALGVRERRLVARHLAHCQPCRHVALMAGVDESLVKPRSIAAKIAAFLPLPLWRWPWAGSRGGRGGPKAGSGASHLSAGLQNAAGLSEPVAGSIALGPAAAAVAVLALAGGGAGLAHALATPDLAHRSAVVRPAAGYTPSRIAPPRSAATPAAAPRIATLQAASRQRIAGTTRSVSRAHRSHPSARGHGSASSAPPASPASSTAAGAAGGTARHLGATAPAGLGSTVSNGAHALSRTVQSTLGGVDKTLGGVGATLSGVDHTLGNVTKTAHGAVNQIPGAVSKVAAGAGIAVPPGADLPSTPSSSAGSTGSTGSNPLSTVTSQIPQPVQDATQPVTSAAGQVADALGSR
ncbi:MAG TPA: sigma-70 family RNA polymerase sigma factor [Solirubrobacteraceae bacterium]